MWFLNSRIIDIEQILRNRDEPEILIEKIIRTMCEETITHLREQNVLNENIVGVEIKIELTHIQRN